jgi:cation diffusion facilitator CzcD-associated flavoprotein CzcO
VLILERSDSLGGTWRDNTYPGAACDVPSALYSFSFAPWPAWSHRYARQPEIRAYLEHCVDRFGVRERIRFGCELVRASFEAGRWRLTIADGTVILARFLILGLGALRDPRWPDLPGLEGFSGTLVHSARWPDGLDLRGQRVGLIGTGASAIQIGPELAPQVASLTVFQRTPPWVNSRDDRRQGPWAKRARAWVPGLMAAERLRTYLRMESRYPLFFGRYHRVGGIGERLLAWRMRRELGPELAARATPSHRLGCKRILASDDWSPMLKRPNVTLETRAIRGVRPDGVELADGAFTQLDALICATGFQVDRPLGDLEITGRDGRDLATVWGHRPRAWLGLTVPGFPNAFLLLGPNTALGHSSVVVMIEAQIRYLVQAIQRVSPVPDGWIDVRPEALDAFVEEVDRRHAARVWTTGCASWYQASDGSQFAIWPGSTLRYLWRTRRFDPSVYEAGTG